MSSLAKQLYTPEEYLALEREAEYKSEYLNGEIIPMSEVGRTNGRIVAMAGAGLSHNTITANFVRVLGNSFVGRPCRVVSSDMRVKVAPTGLYTYPDVVAVCGEIHLEDGRRDTLLNPTVIVEVWSPSTKADDQVAKFEHYRKLESLADYVMVAQDKVHIEHYVRQGAQWLLTEINELSGTLHLTSIGCEVAVKDIYDKVEFSEEDEGSC